MSALLNEFVSYVAVAGTGLIAPAPAPLLHICGSPDDIVRNGFLRGTRNFPGLLSAVVDGRHLPPIEASPGLNVGVPADQIDAAARRLAATVEVGAVALVAPAVRLGDHLVFDARHLEPTRFIPLLRRSDGFDVAGTLLGNLREALAAAAVAAVAADADHRDHAAASARTGFWGRAGAGSVVVARSTGRVLVGLRSREVMEPGTWGTFGGAIDSGMSPVAMALRELREETGFDGDAELVPLLVFEAPGSDFRYHNFAAVVEDEFDPRLNWEHAEAAWFDLDALPDGPGLHFGLRALLADADSLLTLRSIAARAHPRRG